MSKFKVKLDASGNQKNRQTTFHLKAESQKELEKAKRSLLTLLSPVVCHAVILTYIFYLNYSQVTIILHAPASTIPSIIGSKGMSLSVG